MSHTNKKHRPPVRPDSDEVRIEASTKAESTESSRTTRYVALLLLAFTIIAVYGNSMTGPFLFDDRTAIVDNKTIRTIWPLSQSLWGTQDLPTAGRPLVNFSFALNHAAGGLNVFGYHLANVALHVLNAAILFVLLHRSLTRMAPIELWRDRSLKISLIVTALWALHPLQTETVSYITQRSELLMAFFFLATLYTARRAWDAEHRAGRTVWQIVCILCCAMGMACKEVMVVAPVMVLLYDLAILDKPVKLLLRHRWQLYLGLAATWSVLASLMATNPRGLTVGFGLIIKPHEYMTTQFWAITQYLKLSIWPIGLCADYGVFKITEYEIWLPCLLLLLFLAGLSIWSWFRYRSLSFLGCWFFILLAPTSSFIPIVSEPVAERRMYLPLAAVIVLFVFGLVGLVEKFSNSSANLALRRQIVRRPILTAVLIAIALVFAQLTYARNRVYETDLAFWIDVIQKRRENARGYNNLGIAYLNDHQQEHAKENFQRALSISPNDADAHYNLGKWYAEQGFPSEALKHYDRSIAINPKIADPFYNRGLLLVSQGRIDEAIESYQAAIQVSPDLTVAYLNLGNVYFSQSRLDEAIVQYQTVLRLDPQSSDAYSNLGGVLAHSGKYRDAIESLLKAIQIEPNKSDAYFNLGFCYASLGQKHEAIQAYKKCLEIKPDDIDVQKSIEQLQGQDF